MSNELSLYNITEEIKKLDLMFEEAGGEITEEMESLEADVNALLVSKVDACVGYRQRELDLIELAKQRVKSLQDFVKVKTNKVDRFDKYVIECMTRLEKPVLQGQLHSIKIRKPVKSVNITDENKIPAEFVTVETTTKIDKKELAKQLKANVDIPGAELIDGKIGLNIK